MTAIKPLVIEISRIAAFARGFDGDWIKRDYNHRTARRLMNQYTDCECVMITSPRWNTCHTRYRPQAGQIIYVKSVKRRARVYVGQ